LIRCFPEIRVSRRSNRVPIGSIEAEFLPGAADLCAIGGFRIRFLRNFRRIGEGCWLGFRRSPLVQASVASS
jgi:hypothetical protein